MLNEASEVEERIRQRAYVLWEKNRETGGNAEYFWQQAQLEIEAENARSSSQILSSVKSTTKNSDEKLRKPDARFKSITS